MSSVVISGDTSGSVSLTVPSVAGSNTATLPAGTGTIAVQGVSTNIVSGTTVASTSGTSIDFTSIPSWVKRITVMFSGVSTNGSSLVQIQIGNTTFQTSGYVGSSILVNSGGAGAGLYGGAGYALERGTPSTSTVRYGQAILTLLDATSNMWIINSNISYSDSAIGNMSAGGKSLSGTLDRLRLTTVNGTDTFDAGSINILYE